MDLPEPVADALDGESVATTVELGGEDAVYVTPSRTLVYRGDGLLSDASVDVIDHEIERVTLSEGRRKATIGFEHAMDGSQELTVPANSVDAVLEPVLAAILGSTGVTEPGETVTATHRFSELTLVITSHQFLRHIGGAVWSADYDALAWETVTGLSLEEGSVATQLVLETRERAHRTKVPSESATPVYRDVEDALCAAHGVEDYAAFEALIEEETADDEETEEEPADQEAYGGSAGQADEMTGDSLEPIGGSPSESAQSTEEDDTAATDTAEPETIEGSEFTLMTPAQEETEASAKTIEDPQAVLDRLDELEAALERQAELLEDQQETIAALRDSINHDQ